MNMKEVTVTPQMAQALLDNNPMNRSLRLNYVEALARDMQRGAWQFNGESIKVNCDGSLIDGQHRLSACVKSGVPFATVIIEGLPSDVRATIDGGAKRTTGDRLTMSGVDYGNRVAATLRIMMSVAIGHYRGERFSIQEDLRVYDMHPGVIESVKIARNSFPRINNIIGAVHYIGSHLGHGERADAFVRVWRSGVPDFEGDPVHLLREKVVRNSGKTMTTADYQRAIVYTWTHFQNRSPLKIIKVVGNPKIPGWTKQSVGL